MPTISNLVGVVQITGAEAAQSQLKNVGNATKEASSGFKSMLSGAMSFAGAIGITNLVSDAFGFLKDQIGSIFAITNAAAASTATMNAILTSTHDASGMTAQALNNLADAFSRTTEFSSEAVKGGENLLLTFTNIGKNVFPQATKEILEVSQVMGQDLKSSAIEVGKALDNPIAGISSLTRIGVTFSAAEKTQIASMMAHNNIIGAQKIILAELGKEMGNTAEQVGKTLPGQLAILGHGFEDVKKSIGDALMPTFQKLTAFVIANVMPNFQKFATFLASPVFAQFASTVGTDIVAAVQGLITGISTVVSDGANLVNFFKNNQVASDLLLAAFAGIAAGAIAFAVTTIPPLLVSFGAWAVAAGAAAVATLAATWPFIAIGAAVALVVAGIVLAIQHWGQIVQFLQGVWGAFTSWFMGILTTVGTFFAGVWNGMVSGVQSAWNWIVTTVKNGLTLLWNIFTAPFQAIGALFVWLYQHNTYFKMLIDAITGIVTTGLTWLHNAWDLAVKGLTIIWDTLKTLASNAFNAVKTAVMTAVNAVTTWLHNAWDLEVKGLGIIWNGLKDLMGKAWQAVSGLLSGAWSTYVAKPLASLWASIVHFASGWPKDALQFGVNLIQGIIDGITSMLGALGNAAGNAAAAIAKFLGFHSPTELGPGRELDSWPRNMMKTYSAGIVASIPMLQSSLNLAVQPMASVLGPSSGGSIVPSSVTSAPNIVINLPQNDMYLDGMRLTQAQMPYFALAMRNITGANF